MMTHEEDQEQHAHRHQSAAQILGVLFGLHRTNLQLVHVDSTVAIDVKVAERLGSIRGEPLKTARDERGISV